MTSLKAKTFTERISQSSLIKYDSYGNTLFLNEISKSLTSKHEERLQQMIENHLAEHKTLYLVLYFNPDRKEKAQPLFSLMSTCAAHVQAGKNIQIMWYLKSTNSNYSETFEHLSFIQEIIERYQLDIKAFKVNSQ